MKKKIYRDDMQWIQFQLWSSLHALYEFQIKMPLLTNGKQTWNSMINLKLTCRNVDISKSANVWTSKNPETNLDNVFSFKTQKINVTRVGVFNAFFLYVKVATQITVVYEIMMLLYTEPRSAGAKRQLSTQRMPRSVIKV